MEWLADPKIWIALLTLTVLEIVLGVDNVIFISILAGKLPADKQSRARRVGLGLAMFMRIALLASIAWIVKLTAPLFEVLGQEISGRDLILILGGLFLIAKSTHEIHNKLEGEEGHRSAGVGSSFTSVIIQILLLDIVFSLDSVITAIGMAEHLWVMITAVVLAVGVMMVSAKRHRRFRRAPPHGEDPCPQLPAPDRAGAAGRRIQPAHTQGIYLFCHGIFGLRRDDQFEDAQPQAQAGSSPQRLCGRAESFRLKPEGNTCA